MTIRRFFESEEAYQEYLKAEKEAAETDQQSGAQDGKDFLQIIKDLFKSCIPNFSK